MAKREPLLRSHRAARRHPLTVCLLSPHPLVLTEFERLLSQPGYHVKTQQLESSLAPDLRRLALPRAPVYVVDAFAARPATALVAGILDCFPEARVVAVAEKLSEANAFPLLRLGSKGLLTYDEARKSLADFLREDLALTGTHVGCEHGVCGACTILLNGEAARSCLMLAVQADGAEILTVEGLATDGKLHPLQQAFWEHHGLQCGFCTPGMLLTAYDLLRVNPSPTEAEIRAGLSAVLCRCTGYQGIVRAVQAAAERLRAGG